MGAKTKLFFAAFQDELLKVSSATPHLEPGWRGVGPAKAHIPSVLAGAALLYGGNRMYKDWKLGRQVRKGGGGEAPAPEQMEGGY